ncbi:MAG: hypothetical protein LUI12_03510 [Clostridiales bacterium]|nr:hypothetical protein [Clostridiales bacterium]
MGTREELLDSLNEAVSIIQQLANIQQRLTNVRNQYQPSEPSTKRKRRISWLFIIIPALIISVAIDPQKGFFGSIGFVGLIVVIVAGYFVRKYYYQRKNAAIDEVNQALRVKEKGVIEDLQNVQATYQDRLASWYPENYCSVDAVQFFYDVVKNYRADNIKEAINLYETSLHQRRVENNQKQALQQQKLNNLLAVGNLVVQGAALNEMNRHNAVSESEMKKTNWTLDSIRSRLQ